MYDKTILSKLITWALLLLLTSAVVAQEICDDGIDNDGDGLIDLNDIDDCICASAIPAGLIPNPSFEDYIRCPRNENELTGYAVSWIQASAATSDYVHTCGNFFGNSFANNAMAPLPFPDGDGAIGFRDGNTGRPQFKEYVGSNLIESMEVGVAYKLDFFVGFHDHPSSRQFPMAFYATDDPSLLPFGGNNTVFGCPLKQPGYDLLGEVVVEGNNEWVNVVYEFTPTKPYTTIVLGPGCEQHPLWTQEPYFFMDRLTLARFDEFSAPTAITGDICDDLLLIELQEGQLGYQWYFEGVAIIGEVSSVLTLTGNSAEGTYSAMIYTEDGCFYSDSYFSTFPPEEAYFTVEICEGESFFFGNSMVSETDIYSESFDVGNVCDSLSILNLIVNPLTYYDYIRTFCPGEVIEVGGFFYDQEGDYTAVIPNAANCDSTISIQLTVRDTAAEFVLPTLEICQGESSIFGTRTIEQSGIYKDTFIIDTGCDSISTLELIVFEDTESMIGDTLCPGESLMIEGQIYTITGQYEQLLSNVNGCDSLIYIDILQVPHIEQISLIDSLFIDLGQSYTLTPDATADAVRFEWYEDSTLISEEAELRDVIPFNNTTYTLNAYTAYGCLTQRAIAIEVDRTIDVYSVNIMSLSNPAEDNFKLGFDESVSAVKDISIYDRWGELIYRYAGSLEDYTGWDGRFGSGYVEQGVYAFRAVLEIVDGTEATRVGNVMVLR